LAQRAVRSSSVYSYDLANRVTEIRRNPGNLPLLAYTYTGGFVTQTDYGSGLRRTATIDTGYGTPDMTVTTTASAQTLESTNNGHAAAYVDSYFTINGSSDGEYSMMFGGRVWSDIAATYIWDSLSNLRNKLGWQDLLYNPEANRLTQVRYGATVVHSYAHDAAGFVTNRDGVALGYDATGAIASIGSVVAFDHDLSGRPVSRTLNGVTKLFRFGGAIACTPAGSPLELDLGEVVIKLDGSTDRYRHMDYRGNVRFVTSGITVEGHATYSGFGRAYEEGELGERGFAGGFEIDGLGLVVLGPRVLDSDTGRFLSQDPVFNAVNQYTYAQGNPVFYWDPSGRETSGFDIGTGMSFSSISFEFPSSLGIGGTSLGIGGSPGPNGRMPLNAFLNDSEEEEEKAEKGMLIYVGAMLVVAGAETIHAGELTIAAGLSFAGTTRGASAVVGTVAGLGFMGLGAIEIAVGGLIGSGSLGAAGAQTTGAEGGGGAQ
jgi:RHS repeat-associated protein